MQRMPTMFRGMPTISESAATARAFWAARLAAEEERRDEAQQKSHDTGVIYDHEMSCLAPEIQERIREAVTAHIAARVELVLATSDVGWRKHEQAEAEKIIKQQLADARTGDEGDDDDDITT